LPAFLDKQPPADLVAITLLAQQKFIRVCSRWVDIENPGNGRKKTGLPKSRDISATRLSLEDPIGFPPHPREWFSIIVYHYLIYAACSSKIADGINFVQVDARIWSWCFTSSTGFGTQKSRGFVSSVRYFGDPAVL